MIFRIAAGLARNSAPEHRWRRVAVLATAAIFMLLVSAGSSVVAMVQREAERVEQRSALLAGEPSPTDMFLVEGDDVWRGEQFPVIWIEPVGGVSGTSLPPGVPRLPEPGQAVVSPALDQMAELNPDLARRYPDRLVLGSEGIRSEDELFAYVRTPEGRTIAKDERAMRVSAFGPPSDAMPAFPLASWSSDGVTVTSVLGGVLGFLGVPGLIVLAVGLATASSVRDHRFEVLRWIGGTRQMLVMLAMWETLVLAIPGLILATVFWWIASPRLEVVPLVGHEVVHGDLGLPWWLLIVELVVSTIVISVIASVASVFRRRYRTSLPRPDYRRTFAAPLRMVPLGVALVSFVLGRVAQGSPAANLNLVGIVATVIGVPLVLPGVLRMAGRILARFDSVPTLIAGRGLEWDPVRTSRPFVGGAALIVIVLVGSGYVALARDVEKSPVPAGDVRAVTVNWLDARPSDTDQLADEIGSGLVVPLYDNELRGEGGAEALEIGATCQQLFQYFPGPACNPEQPYKLSKEMEQRLIETLAVGTPGMKVRLVAADEVTNKGSVLVLDKAPLEALETRVRSSVMPLFTAPYVDSMLSSAVQESPLVPWLLGGMTLSVIVLSVGCLISLVDRLLETRKHRRHLLNLGVSTYRLTLLEAWRFATPYGTVVAASFSAGLTICMLMVGFSRVPMPWYTIVLTLVVTVVAGVIGTAGVAFLGAREVSKEPE